MLTESIFDERDCPVEFTGEPCPVKQEQEYLMKTKEWFEPGVNVLKVGGFGTTMELHFREGHVKSFEDLKELIEDITEKMHLKDYLVYKVCPECGLDLPRIDFRNDHCVFCSVKSTQLTSEKRLPEETK